MSSRLPCEQPTTATRMVEEGEGRREGGRPWMGREWKRLGGVARALDVVYERRRGCGVVLKVTEEGKGADLKAARQVGSVRPCSRLFRLAAHLSVLKYYSQEAVFHPANSKH
jgi:hypothetical protein